MLTKIVAVSVNQPVRKLTTWYVVLILIVIEIVQANDFGQSIDWIL